MRMSVMQNFKSIGNHFAHIDQQKKTRLGYDSPKNHGDDECQVLVCEPIRL